MRFTLSTRDQFGFCSEFLVEGSRFDFDVVGFMTLLFETLVDVDIAGESKTNAVPGFDDDFGCRHN